MRGTVKAGNAMCAGKEYEEDACQRFAVIPPLSGTLEVTLTAPFGSALDIVNPRGEAFAEFSGVMPMRLPASAGGTYEIRVVTDRFARVDFELKASLK